MFHKKNDYHGFLFCSIYLGEHNFKNTLPFNTTHTEVIIYKVSPGYIYLDFSLLKKPIPEMIKTANHRLHRRYNLVQPIFKIFLTIILTL